MLLVYAAVLIATKVKGREGEPVFRGATLGAVAVLALVVQYVSFFWGCHHLAKGKGQSSGMILVGALGPLIQFILLLVIHSLPDHHEPHLLPGSSPRAKRSRESSVARIVRFRRNAFLGNLIGLIGILIALSLVFFPTGLAVDPGNETALAVFIFAVGYCGVLTGCWWWAKAKAWTEGIVGIGLLPLVILFIPWVRLIYVEMPGLLPAAMVMMPLILLVIMFVLPDKSGIQKRKTWERD